MYYGAATALLHSSPRRLAGEKKVPAIIIKQQFGFPFRDVVRFSNPGVLAVMWWA